MSRRESFALLIVIAMSLAAMWRVNAAEDKAAAEAPQAKPQPATERLLGGPDRYLTHISTDNTTQKRIKVLPCPHAQHNSAFTMSTTDITDHL